MSQYMQPFAPDEIDNGTAILTLPLDIGGQTASCSFVNSTPYWFRVKDKTGMVIAFIGPNTKGNENFTMAVEEKVIIERYLQLKPVTSAASTNLFYIRFNPFDGSGGLSDYNTNTAMGSSTSQEVHMSTPLPTGNNTIGKVGLTAGTAHLGSVDIDKMPDLDILSMPDVGLKPGQTVNVGNFPAVQRVTVDNMSSMQEVEVTNFPVASKTIERAMTGKSLYLEVSDTGPASVSTVGAIGYMVQAGPNNAKETHILNGHIMYALLPGQIAYVDVPIFTAQTPPGAGQQILYYTPFERVEI